LLRQTFRLLSDAGFVIGNVAVQVIGNRPRVAPRRAEAEKVMSEALFGASVSEKKKKKKKKQKKKLKKEYT